jgi:F0F1-type ATP synthase assembly protein I
MHEVTDTTAAAIPAIRALARDNGVYFSRYGLLMAVRVAPDKSDQTSAAAMGPMLLKQLGVDLIAVAALCAFVGFLLDRSPLGVAKAMSLAGFAMITLQEAGMAIWYSFSPGWAAVNIADQTISFFLTGLVLGALMPRLNRDNPVALPEGQGYRTSGGRKTTAR